MSIRPLIAAMILSFLPTTARAAEPVDFAHQIVPILREHCAECHAGDKRKGGFSINTRELMLSHGDELKSVVPGKAEQSELVLLLTEPDADLRMPADAPALPIEKIKLIERWINEGAQWEPGFTFGESAYEPPLEPRRPELPAARNGATNPIDRIVDAYYAEHGVTPPGPVSDAVFIRRLYMDVIGLLPSPVEVQAFVADAAPDKRQKLIDAVLDMNRAYAEHWLTFWNDLLRNEYKGTGYIDGGRRQITPWLYAALLENKPYDQFVRELIAPSGESEGFIRGIKWRGRVNASQTREIQFAQNVSQVFLGINMKCASCHDSFIDDWKLADAYGLAAITATEPLEIHRCDKPTGETARAAFIFPALGSVDASAPRDERLRQLAELMTHPNNGRTTRTIVNRIWHRMMGRGIVHPVDAMANRPWSEDLLDYLAVNLVDGGWDLRATMRLIANSRAYQSAIDAREAPADAEFVFAGPIARRMTAEQFMDGVWAITGAGPNQINAPIQRPAPDGSAAPAEAIGPAAQWIWSYAEASAGAPAGETITLRRTFELAQAPRSAFAVVTCDNQYTLRVNGKDVGGDDDWTTVERLDVTGRLKAGRNTIEIVAKNLGGGPNPAGLYMQLLTFDGEKWATALVTDAQWQATPGALKPGANAGVQWKPAAVVARQDFLGAQVRETIAQALLGVQTGGGTGGDLVRAVLVHSDPLMRSLGRPNREQVVTTRPDELSTLQALDLSNGDVFANTLKKGADRLMREHGGDPARLIDTLYLHALARPATPREAAIARQMVGNPMTPDGVADLLWAVFMLPEYQLIR